ncbi:MAG: putative peroxiredoxin [Verrucomicrobiales bacterium]|nr:putative peroxiredoxin [Verrucomicrobiales bacterium]
MRQIRLRPIMIAKKLFAVVIATFMAISTCIGGGVSPEQIGLPVGKPAPQFTLRDQNGNEISLAVLLKKGPVAVVFVRSADWCLYCKMQLAQIQRNLKEIESTGGQIVSISYDSTEKIRRFAGMRKISFPLLSDADSKTIDAYAMRDTDSDNGSSNHGTFIVDQQGLIRAKPLVLNFSDRPAVDALVNALKAAKKEK